MYCYIYLSLDLHIEKLIAKFLADFNFIVF